jgi:hypothetical protein
MNEFGTAYAELQISRRINRRKPKRRNIIMTSINFDAVRSLAVAGVVSLYAALMLAAAMGASSTIA